MGPITLFRIDQAKRRSRFYRFDVQPTMFGQWSLIREWGRIGSPGRIRIVVYPTLAAAEAALDRLRHAKEQRGYVR